MSDHFASDRLNPTLLSTDIYASKAISLRAHADPAVADLSFGEPVFGPPAHLLDDIERGDLGRIRFLDAAKRYEEARGSIALREAIAAWYRQRYELVVDPEREVLVTHGGVEAITLALLATTSTGDRVGVCDPSYMLYARAVGLLGRVAAPLRRPALTREYTQMLLDPGLLDGVRAMIVNSPENPTGYVVDDREWHQIAEATQAAGTWVIHDEVYDVMAFDRPHRPARAVEALRPNAVLVNSFSKKFGLPGLRIGWMVGPAHVVEQAAKAHDYLYLGVNIQYERIATRLLNDARRDGWLAEVGALLQKRRLDALARLGEPEGFAWPRAPLGAMFLFPDVLGIYARMPPRFREGGVPVGDAVTRYLLEMRKVAVVPGSVYGRQGESHVRLVTCTSQETFDRALDRLSPASI